MLQAKQPAPAFSSPKMLVEALYQVDPNGHAQAMLNVVKQQ